MCFLTKCKFYTISGSFRGPQGHFKVFWEVFREFSKGLRDASWTSGGYIRVSGVLSECYGSIRRSQECYKSLRGIKRGSNKVSGGLSIVMGLSWSLRGNFFHELFGKFFQEFLLKFQYGGNFSESFLKILQGITWRDCSRNGIPSLILSNNISMINLEIFFRDCFRNSPRHSINNSTRDPDNK